QEVVSRSSCSAWESTRVRGASSSPWLAAMARSHPSSTACSQGATTAPMGTRSRSSTDTSASSCVWCPVPPGPRRKRVPDLPRGGGPEAGGGAGERALHAVGGAADLGVALAKAGYLDRVGGVFGLADVPLGRLVGPRQGPGGLAGGAERDV